MKLDCDVYLNNSLSAVITVPESTFSQVARYLEDCLGLSSDELREGDMKFTLYKRDSNNCTVEIGTGRYATKEWIQK